MTKVRQDAWSKENDLLLADTVLRHVREGGTQLKAFEEVGDKLNRTSAACGFRWNAVVRDQYKQAIEIAKKQRKERKRLQSVGSTNSSKPQTAAQPVSKQNQSLTAETTLDDVIVFLQGLKENGQSQNELAQENDRLQQENERLLTEKEEVQKQLDKLENEHQTVKEDYQSLMQIMDRARKMVAFGGEEQNSAFRMDKNGNLEKIAK